MKKIIILLFLAFLSVFFINTNSYAVGRHGANWENSVIKVYIPQDEYADMMKQAFDAWVKKCNGRLSFEYTVAAPADIEVEFADKTDGTDGDIGAYSLTVKGGFITKATITIAPKPEENSANLIYTVMLHEIGHALGLKDTSRKLGIMSTPVTEKQDIMNHDVMRLYQLNGWHYMNLNTPVTADN